MLKKIKSTSGFSLTEVMIGIMILTVAIISASNLLVSLVKTNRLNVETLQAYYLAQEGVEAVRNIRDTNWLHNLDFRGVKSADEGLCGGLYGCIETGNIYSVSLSESGWRQSNTQAVIVSQSDLGTMKPWNFKAVNSPENFNPSYAISKNSSGFYGEGSGDKFYRHIEILNACDHDEVLNDSFLADLQECDENFILVKSVVNWMDGPNEREISLEAVLSDWKGGAL